MELPTSSSPSLTTEKVQFCHVAKSHDGSGQSVGITNKGETYTWGPLNGLGQLGRVDGPKRQPRPAQFSLSSASSSSSSPSPLTVQAIRGYAGGTADAGHSAVLDSKHRLWMTGCDRWQQLGLGSSSSGAAGYTWTALWQTSFQYNPFIAQLMSRHCSSGNNSNHNGAMIRHVALGGDHTLVLSANQRDVFSFGKGSEGQLGLANKPFVSTPAHAKGLSVQEGQDKIGALCAIQHCSIALDETGKILKEAGKCSGLNSDHTSSSMALAFQACRESSKRDGLVHF